MGIQKLEHVGVVVKSIDESVAFYEKVLGMELKGYVNLIRTYDLDS